MNIGVVGLGLIGGSIAKSAKKNTNFKVYGYDIDPKTVKNAISENSIDEIATMAYLMNEQTENIGARRLHTILEKLLEDISFNIPEMEEEEIVIDREYVQEKFKDTVHKDDMDRYIL